MAPSAWERLPTSEVSSGYRRKSVPREEGKRVASGACGEIREASEQDKDVK